MTPEQSARAGGKGATLARLHRDGYPVPGGFVFLTDSFEGDELKPGLWEQAVATLARMRNKHPGCRFAVRSSALGDDVFMLTIQELLDLLAGKDGVVRYVPARRATYERYCALPPYPVVISGRFDPFAWAADPDRRSDVFDSHVTRPLTAPTRKVLRGVGGANGVVEGRVRRLEHFEQGAALEPGEILVTNTTNVGWTPLFPRAAAIVTDVGALLSHAAIVARELGIPAVVGCGDATTRLHTGDHGRVNGAQGTVEIL